MAKRKSSIRRIVRVPKEYLEAMQFGNVMFPPLFQFENGLRLAVDKHLTVCYGVDWWNIKLKTKKPDIWQYAEDMETKNGLMPWIGASARITIQKIHLITLGQLEEIVKNFRSECFPQLFPTLEFFVGHMECIKRVRNLYSHMFPCMTKGDCKLAKREIATLADHINTKL